MSNLIKRHLKIPKYLQLAEYLREKIDNGELQPGDPLPSFNMMKAQFDAAQRTIEKAHLLLEKDGLIRRDPGRGIFVNYPVQRKKTGNIGFIAPYSLQSSGSMSYWGLVLSGMLAAARNHDYHLLIIDDSKEFDEWDKIDGALLYDNHDQRDPLPFEQHPPEDFPCISLFNKVANMPCVTEDDTEATYQLTRYLIELGHTRIGYLAAVESGLSMLENRKKGYLKALSEADLTANPDWCRDLRRRAIWADKPLDWLTYAGEYYMRQWIEDDWAEQRCTAIVTQNDKAAQGVIRALQGAGLGVPQDVSVTGFDGLLAENSKVQLTTINAPLFEVGKQAMYSLLDYLRDPREMPQDVYIPVSVTLGETTAPPRELPHKSTFMEAPKKIIDK